MIYDPNQIRVYTDGGVIGRNPSATGGTWAFVFIPASPTAGREYWPTSLNPLTVWIRGVCVVRDSGVVLPSDLSFLDQLRETERLGKLQSTRAQWLIGTATRVLTKLGIPFWKGRS